MADSEKHQADELSPQEAADPLDCTTSSPTHSEAAASVGDLGADTTAASFADIVTNNAQTIAVGVAVSVAADDLLRHRNRRPRLVRHHARELVNSVS